MSLQSLTKPEIDLDNLAKSVHQQLMKNLPPLPADAPQAQKAMIEGKKANIDKFQQFLLNKNNEARLRSHLADIPPNQHADFLQFLFDNNPTPWDINAGMDVMLESLARRKASSQPDQYRSVVRKLKEPEAAELADKFQQMGTRVIAQWTLTQPEYKDDKAEKKLSSVYHRAPHGAEMRKDAELLLKDQAKKLFPNQGEVQRLYIEMAKTAHAIHDVIQAKGPIANEKECHRLFVEQSNKIFDEFLAQHPDKGDQIQALKRVTENFSWDTIVVGTVFDFGKKRPMIDALNEASVKFKAPHQRDPAVGWAAFSAGRNDTGRMLVTLKASQHDPHLKGLLDQQQQFVGEDNLFERFMEEEKLNDDEKIAARHLLGQNGRMIPEMRMHLPKKTQADQIRDEGFAQEFTGFIREASEAFSGKDREDLLKKIQALPEDKINEYFSLLMDNFKGPFGEIAFARAISAEKFKQAVNDHNKLNEEHPFDLTQATPDMWERYASNLERFAADLEQKAKDDPRLKAQLVRDLALYGGHQMGAALVRDDHHYISELNDNIIKKLETEVKAKDNVEVPTGLPEAIKNTRSEIKELAIKLESLKKETTPNQGAIDQLIEQMKPLKDKLERLEGLKNAIAERDLVTRQKEKHKKALQSGDHKENVAHEGERAKPKLISSQQGTKPPVGKPQEPLSPRVTAPETETGKKEERPTTKHPGA
ncbi:MAG: hypothetical protein ACHQJ6_01500 [Candidatus Berkiellales bacterium]